MTPTYFIMVFGRCGTVTSFGRQVRGRAGQALRCGCSGKDVAREAEIKDHHTAAGCHQDVGRLDVSMELPSLVQRANALDKLPKGMPDPLGMERRRRSRRATNVFHEIDSLNKFHRKETSRAVHHQLVKRHEVRVRDVGEASKFALEPVDVAWHRAQQRLQRDDLVADVVVNFVDHAHATRPQLPAYAEAIGPGEVDARAD